MHELNKLIAFVDGRKQSTPILVQFQKLHPLYKDNITKVDPDGDLRKSIDRLVQITLIAHTDVFVFEDLFEAMFISVEISKSITVSN